VHHAVTVEGPGELGGTVRTAAGPVTGVRVSVAGGDGPALASTVTDATGAFHLPGVPPGEHLLVVAPTGRPPVLQRVTVTPTGAVHRDVVLPGATARRRPAPPEPAAEEQLVPGLR
jgi:Carboxypeptidase regulatory-like domain